MRFVACVGPLDSLLRSLRSCLDGFPDKRRGINTTYSMGDIGMAAFSVFFMQSPSFLAHQRQFEAGHGRSNGTSLFGIAKIPCDTHIRDILDPASPTLLHPVFAETVDQIRHIDGGLDVFRRLGGHVLIALDGTEYHCSRKIHCRHCSTRLRGKGETEYYHSMLAATLVAPGHDKVIPLEPEFIVPQDGAEKQDCENMAAKRWLATHGRRYAAFEETTKRGKQRASYRYRWLHDVPLRAGDDALKVNWFEIEIRNAQGETTYRNSFITDLPVGRENVVELAACGRARWKIENETFNVLKNKGYNLEHSFGHGKQNLAAILVALNLLAFAIHTVCDIGDDLWRAARGKLGPRYNFFNKLAA